jgi:hypothetical protein
MRINNVYNYVIKCASFVKCHVFYVNFPSSYYPKDSFKEISCVGSGLIFFLEPELPISIKSHQVFDDPSCWSSLTYVSVDDKIV